MDTLLRGPGMARGTNPTRTKAVLTEEETFTLTLTLTLKTYS